MDLGPVCPHLRTAARVGWDPWEGQKWKARVCRKSRKVVSCPLAVGGGEQLDPKPAGGLA